MAVYRIALALAVAATISLAVSPPGIAQTRPRPTAPAQPAPAALAAQPQPKASADLNKLNSALRAEKHLDAKTHAEKLVQTGKPAEKLAATLAYGRILLALEMTKETAAYLKQMRGLNLGREGDKQLLDVYQAWLDAQNGNADAAIKSLQAMLQRGLPVDSTADAADVLAILQLQKGDSTQAKASVDFGLKLIEFHELKTPYQEALLKRRLAQGKKDAVPQIGEAVALYKKAEELRAAEKFNEAAPYYQSIAANHKASEWAPAAEFRIGQCLVGLGSHDKAKEHWQAFLKSKPDGPWRGQAHVELIDIALEHEIDLPAAALQTGIAQSALSSITDADAKESWNAAAFDLHLRSGLVALAQDHRADSATHFENAKRAPGAPTSSLAVSRLDALIKSLQANQDPLPTDLRGPRNSEEVNILLTLGSAYNRLGRHDAALRILSRLAATRQGARPPALRVKNRSRTPASASPNTARAI